MKHEERWQVAVELAEQMARTYPEKLLLGGVYGSTARETDTAWSDLEMLFVVEESCEAKGKHVLFRGITLGYRVYRRSELENIVRHPSLKWPFHMGMLSVLKVLYGDVKLIDEWLALGRAAPNEEFRSVLLELLPDLVNESYGRVMSCRVRGNTRDVTHAAIEVIYEIRDALCLLNRRWVTHDYWQGIVDTFSFPNLPQDYEALVTGLWEARDLDAIVEKATELVDNWTRLLRDKGLLPTDYQRVRDIPI